MRLVFSLCARYDRTPDGAIWIKTGFAYQYWTRFLDVFDSVRVVSRVRDVPSVPSDSLRVDGHRVSVAAVPHYLGPWEYLLRANEVRRASEEAVAPGDAVILFGGSSISGAIAGKLRRIGYPYAVHVGTDPYDMFAPGSIRHPLRPLIRWMAPRSLRKLCAGASAVVYVTQSALQRRYPCPGFSIGVSDVELPDDAFRAGPRVVREKPGPSTIVMVGTLAQLYKAPDVLIDAVCECVRDGLDLRLAIVGDGKHRPELEAHARSLGIGDRVAFRGTVSAGGGVRAELDQADLFVLASHQEGLPRAMVEAMARALPCIGSTVGGIPELLPDEDMVPPGDASALAGKICEVLRDPRRMSSMSERGLAKAREFREEALLGRRTAFLTCVRDQTARWMAANAGYAAAEDAVLGEVDRI